MGVATPAALQIAIIPDAHRGRHETITLDAGSSAPLEHAFRATMKDLQYLDQLDTPESWTNSQRQLRSS